MPKWLPRILLRIHELVAHGHVRFTHKANEELKLLSLNEEDGIEIIAGLAAKDFAARLTSEATGEWMYVFKPLLGFIVVYVKLVLRGSCIVVSFHEEQNHEDD
jgi:Motility quorum-sensing regulator, toxin of MqsA